MSPVGWGIKWIAERFPRVSGDEPVGEDGERADRLFSPRERG